MSETISVSVPSTGVADPEQGNVSTPEAAQTPAVPTAPQIQSDSSRPAGLPETYADVQAMADALASAERKITELGQANSAANPKTVSELLAQAGQDLASGGVIEATTKAGLIEQGITEELQANILAGNTALAEQRNSQILEMFGGQEAYDEFASWAPDNLNQSEIQTLNTLIDSAFTGGDMSAVSLAVAGALHKKGDSGPAALVSGVPAVGGSVTAYASKSEAMKVIGSAEYKSGDPNIHKMHLARLAKSDRNLFSGG